MKALKSFAPTSSLGTALALSLGMSCGIASAGPAVVSFTTGTIFNSGCAR